VRGLLGMKRVVQFDKRKGTVLHGRAVTPTRYAKERLMVVVLHKNNKIVKLTKK
jgi:hypothetical protein